MHAKTSVADPCPGLSSFYTELMRGVGASTRIFELLAQKPAIPIAGGARPEQLQGHVQFQNVQFRYPTRPETAVLRGLTITCEPGYANTSESHKRIA